jgi:hypothetical protein
MKEIETLDLDETEEMDIPVTAESSEEVTFDF